MKRELNSIDYEVHSNKMTAIIEKYFFHIICTVEELYTLVYHTVFDVFVIIHRHWSTDLFFIIV